MNSIEEFRKRYDFDINNAIGRGGFGEVYKGRDLITGLDVAIKKSEASSDTNRYSLLEEFEKGKSFSHPNLLKYLCAYRFTTTVGAFDFGVMEYVNGGDLDDFMRTFPSQQQINKLLLGILEGLTYLHGMQIVHRDLKPGNILINYDKDGYAIPKIIDFGISKKLRSDVSVASNIIGSYEYMSPEQLGASGREIRPNSDLWSFGVVMYQLFTGDLPFGSRAQTNSSGEIVGKIISGSIPEDIEIIPQPYRAIIEACLIKDSTKRVSSTTILLDVLNGKSDISVLPGYSNPLSEQQNQLPQEHNDASEERIFPLTDFPKAGLGKRFLACFLDSLFLIILVIPGTRLSLVLFGDMSYEHWMMPVFALVPSLAYLLFKDAINNGQSWGKKIMGLRVLSIQDFKVCDRGKSILKNFIFLLLILIPFAVLIEVIFLLTNDKYRGLSELVSGTQVVVDSDYQFYTRVRI